MLNQVSRKLQIIRVGKTKIYFMYSQKKFLGSLLALLLFFSVSCTSSSSEGTTSSKNSTSNKQSIAGTYLINNSTGHFKMEVLENGTFKEYKSEIQGALDQNKSLADQKYILVESVQGKWVRADSPDRPEVESYYFTKMNGEYYASFQKDEYRNLVSPNQNIIWKKQ